MVVIFICVGLVGGADGSGDGEGEDATKSFDVGSVLVHARKKIVLGARALRVKQEATIEHPRDDCLIATAGGTPLVR